MLLGVMGSLTAFVIYAFALYLGYASFGIVPFAVGISLIGVWGSYYGSDKLVLKMTGAKLIQREDNPELFNVIEEVVIASGLPMPKVAIVEDTAPNAFATGRDPDHALIAFTTRILEVMDRDELQGVIAHELSHNAAGTEDFAYIEQSQSRSSRGFNTPMVLYVSNGRNVNLDMAKRVRNADNYSLLVQQY